jgi:8-oxo-dGTP diphosphatase
MSIDDRTATRYCWRCAALLEHAPPVVCGCCGQDHFNNPKPAAEAVVERDGTVLLVRRAQHPWRGHWDIPGGFCEPGEHPIHAAERELLEEAGLHARVVALIGIWIDEYGAPHPDGMQESTLNITYLARALQHEPQASPDGETTEMEWFALNALPAALAFPKPGSTA